MKHPTIEAGAADARAEVAKPRLRAGCYDMGFLGGRDRTYSGASQDDMDAFQLWYDKQPEVIEARAATPIKE